MITGYILLLLAGICQGSFGLGYKKHTPLSWEVFWCVYNLFCFLVMGCWTFLKQPDFAGLIASVPPRYFWLPFVCGMVWGVSTLAFSQSVLMVGMSLCFGISMGMSAVVGSIIPFFSGNQELSTGSMVLFVIGVLITLAGIATITKAGVARDAGSGPHRNMRLGVILAVGSGVCSGMMNIGFEYAATIGVRAASDVSAAAVQWFPVITGGVFAVVICCGFLACKNHSWHTIKNPNTPRRLAILLGTAVVWFAALALYGVASKLTAGTGVSWLLFNALALMVSNFWGIKTGEWIGHPKEKKLLFIGDAILVLSWIVISMMP